MYIITGISVKEQMKRANEILVNDREYAGVCNAYMADFLDSVKSFGEMAC